MVNGLVVGWVKGGFWVETAVLQQRSLNSLLDQVIVGLKVAIM
jgi:hypothetical protein